ncbi:unnamed protein product [Amoebophrya sp. A120]|nr:unnamed protein product [Amoebophrya sp. A120]|eukprot:GSA120T00005145001.1
MNPRRQLDEADAHQESSSSAGEDETDQSFPAQNLPASVLEAVGGRARYPGEHHSIHDLAPLGVVPPPQKTPPRSPIWAAAAKGKGEPPQKAPPKYILAGRSAPPPVTLEGDLCTLPSAPCVDHATSTSSAASSVRSRPPGGVPSYTLFGTSPIWSERRSPAQAPWPNAKSASSEMDIFSSSEPERLVLPPAASTSASDVVAAPVVVEKQKIEILSSEEREQRRPSPPPMPPPGPEEALERNSLGSGTALDGAGARAADVASATAGTTLLSGLRLEAKPEPREIERAMDKSAAPARKGDSEVEATVEHLVAPADALSFSSLSAAPAASSRKGSASTSESSSSPFFGPAATELVTGSFRALEQESRQGDVLAKESGETEATATPEEAEKDKLPSTLAETEKELVEKMMNLQLLTSTIDKISREGREVAANYTAGVPGSLLAKLASLQDACSEVHKELASAEASAADGGTSGACRLAQDGERPQQRDKATETNVIVAAPQGDRLMEQAVEDVAEGSSERKTSASQGVLDASSSAQRKTEVVHVATKTRKKTTNFSAAGTGGPGTKTSPQVATTKITQAKKQANDGSRGTSEEANDRAVASSHEAAKTAGVHEDERVQQRYEDAIKEKDTSARPALKTAARSSAVGPSATSEAKPVQRGAAGKTRAKSPFAGPRRPPTPPRSDNGDCRGKKEGLKISSPTSRGEGTSLPAEEHRAGVDRDARAAKPEIAAQHPQGAGRADNIQIGRGTGKSRNTSRSKSRSKASSSSKKASPNSPTTQTGASRVSERDRKMDELALADNLAEGIEKSQQNDPRGQRTAVPVAHRVEALPADDTDGYPAKLEVSRTAHFLYGLVEGRGATKLAFLESPEAPQYFNEVARLFEIKLRESGLPAQYPRLCEYMRMLVAEYVRTGDSSIQVVGGTIGLNNPSAAASVAASSGSSVLLPTDTTLSGAVEGPRGTSASSSWNNRRKGAGAGGAKHGKSGKGQKDNRRGSRSGSDDHDMDALDAANPENVAQKMVEILGIVAKVQTGLQRGVQFLRPSFYARLLAREFGMFVTEFKALYDELLRTTLARGGAPLRRGAAEAGDGDPAQGSSSSGRDHSKPNNRKRHTKTGGTSGAATTPGAVRPASAGAASAVPRAGDTTRMRFPRVWSRSFWRSVATRARGGGRRQALRRFGRAFAQSRGFTLGCSVVIVRFLFDALMAINYFMVLERSLILHNVPPSLTTPYIGSDGQIHDPVNGNRVVGVETDGAPLTHGEMICSHLPRPSSCANIVMASAAQQLQGLSVVERANLCNDALYDIARYEQAAMRVKQEAERNGQEVETLFDTPHADLEASELDSTSKRFFFRLVNYFYPLRSDVMYRGEENAPKCTTLQEYLSAQQNAVKEALGNRFERHVSWDELQKLEAMLEAGKKSRTQLQRQVAVAAKKAREGEKGLGNDAELYQAAALKRKAEEVDLTKRRRKEEVMKKKIEHEWSRFALGKRSGLVNVATRGRYAVGDERLGDVVGAAALRSADVILECQGPDAVESESTREAAVFPILGALASPHAATIMEAALEYYKAHNIRFDGTTGTEDRVEDGRASASSGGSDGAERTAEGTSAPRASADELTGNIAGMPKGLSELASRIFENFYSDDFVSAISSTLAQQDQARERNQSFAVIATREILRATQAPALAQAAADAGAARQAASAYSPQTNLEVSSPATLFRVKKSSCKLVYKDSKTGLLSGSDVLTDTGIFPGRNSQRADEGIERAAASAEFLERTKNLRASLDAVSFVDLREKLKHKDFLEPLPRFELQALISRHGQMLREKALEVYRAEVPEAERISQQAEALKALAAGNSPDEMIQMDLPEAASTKHGGALDLGTLLEQDPKTRADIEGAVAMRHMVRLVIESGGNPEVLFFTWKTASKRDADVFRDFTWMAVEGKDPLRVKMKVDGGGGPASVPRNKNKRGTSAGAGGAQKGPLSDPPRPAFSWTGNLGTNVPRAAIGEVIQKHLDRNADAVLAEEVRPRELQQLRAGKEAELAPRDETRPVEESMLVPRSVGDPAMFRKSLLDHEDVHIDDTDGAPVILPRTSTSEGARENEAVKDGNETSGELQQEKTGDVDLLESQSAGNGASATYSWLHDAHAGPPWPSSSTSTSLLPSSGLRSLADSNLLDKSGGASSFSSTRDEREVDPPGAPASAKNAASGNDVYSPSLADRTSNSARQHLGIEKRMEILDSAAGAPRRHPSGLERSKTWQPLPELQYVGTDPAKLDPRLPFPEKVREVAGPILDQFADHFRQHGSRSEKVHAMKLHRVEKTLRNDPVDGSSTSGASAITPEVEEKLRDESRRSPLPMFMMCELGEAECQSTIAACARNILGHGKTAKINFASFTIPPEIAQKYTFPFHKNDKLSDEGVAATSSAVAEFRFALAREMLGVLMRQYVPASQRFLLQLADSEPNEIKSERLLPFFTKGFDGAHWYRLEGRRLARSAISPTGWVPGGLLRDALSTPWEAHLQDPNVANSNYAVDVDKLGEPPARQYFVLAGLLEQIISSGATDITVALLEEA